RRPPRSPLFPYTTLFRSLLHRDLAAQGIGAIDTAMLPDQSLGRTAIEEPGTALAAGMLAEAPLGIGADPGVQVPVLRPDHVHPPGLYRRCIPGAVFIAFWRHTGDSHSGGSHVHTDLQYRRHH